MRSLLLLLFSILGLHAADTRPNIIVILADDMGFSDIGCYGSEIPTPNIDRLADHGVRFRHFYNNARCCPTRASLLTGAYSHRAGVGWMTDDKRVPETYRELSKEIPTIAERLRKSGYRTGMAGKWHVGGVLNTNNWPRQRGFDSYLGIIHGADSYFDPLLTRDNETLGRPKEQVYLTDTLAAEAARFVRENETRPFFLYLAFNSPHWPLHARELDITQFEKRYERGWDQLRAERFERMKKFGSIPPDAELTPRPEKIPAWETVQDKKWEARRMAVYAAQIAAMDRAIGTVVVTLEKQKLLENTLIFFLSDNGGCAENLGPAMKAIFVPPQTADGKPMRTGNAPDILPGAPDTYASYGEAWANASNTPFRLYKHWDHEGGIASPLVVHYPARIKKSKWTDQVGHVIDIAATCLDAAGIQTARGELDGASLLPACIGNDVQSRKIFWEHEGNKAVRDGDWKLVTRFKGSWELYNLAKDPTELQNLAGKEAARVERMRAEWEKWAERNHVIQWESFLGEKR